MEPTLPTSQTPQRRRYYLRLLVIFAIIFTGFLIYVNQPPKYFPVGGFVTISSGESLSSVAKELKSKKIIKSSILFKSLVILSAGEQKMIAGDYYFNQPISTFTVSSRLINGRLNLTQVKVTIPEGLSMEQTSKIIQSKLPEFSVADFMKYSPEKEGYLFPDTYFFKPNVSAGEVIEIMENNFKDKIKTIESKILASGKSEKEIITMASILEEEARTLKDWQIISGILWKRINIGMPLQVDASLGYVINKGSNQLTIADLKNKSPYNTYTHKGLPPTPIASPGLQTITAAITPVKTPYLYYLSDKNGVIYYAATFEDHIINRGKYLK